MLCRLAIIFTLLHIALTSEEMDQSVIIIGSGLSGFSAARKLMENDFDQIMILEAENRIGGRIHSVPFSDGVIDLGAQWVHGQKKNIIYEMTKDYFDFGSTPFEEINPIFVLSNGTRPDQKLFGQIYELGFNIFQSIDDLEDPKGSIGEIFLKKLDNALKTSSKKFGKLDPKIIELMKDDMHKNINGYCATKSWFDLSAKLNSEEETTKGNQYNTWKKLGFKTYFDYLTKKAPNLSEYLNIEAKVQLNKKVTSIKYNKNSASSNVNVSCADGSSYAARHVIFTGSLGVLKKFHESMFIPQLPQQKILAIKNYGFGTVGKVFLEFDNPFWRENGNEFVAYEFLWLDDDKEEVKSANREWLIDVTGVYAVDNFPNVLEFFLGGGKLNEFEGSTDQKIIDDCMWLLQKTSSKTLPSPKAMKRTKWLTNDNFLGSYSYGSIDAENANVGVKQLASSIKNVDEVPIILFAGEATDFKFPSMAHGAVRSGFRAASEIIKYYEEK